MKKEIMTKQTKQVELPEEVNNEIVIAFMTPLQEKLSDILQPLLEIAEGKRNIDEWNDYATKLLTVAEDDITQAQQEAVEVVKSMKKPIDNFKFIGSERDQIEVQRDMGYNEALDDVLEALQKEQE